MGASQPRGGQRVGFIRVEHVNSALAQQLADLQSGGDAAPSCVHDMHRRANFHDTRSQLRIAERNQFRSVATFAEALYKQKSLVLSAAVFAAEVDDQRAHAQASPGLGQERRASFSPASNRPNLRYFR